MKRARSDENPLITVRRVAMNLLAHREQSFAELLQKLTQKFPDLDREEVILPALERLREEDLQSDDRFLESYVRYRMQAGMGPLRIDTELGRKGVSSIQARAAIYHEDYDWAELCRDAMTKRFSEAPPVDMAEKQKRYRFLQQRGFGSEQIRQVLD
jgi:regulatory protein